MSKTSARGTMQPDWEIGPDGIHGVRQASDGQMATYDPINDEVILNSPKVIPFHRTPASNGVIYLVGGYEIIDTGEALSSGSPVTASDPYFNTRMIITISAAVGLPFTVRVTGTSVDQDDGSLIPADTEDIDVTANGVYATTKYWITDPQVSILEAAKSCTVDLAREFAWNMGGRRLTVNSLFLLWEPGLGLWNIRLVAQKVAADGTVTTIEDVTFISTDSPPRASSGTTGRFVKRNYNELINGKEGDGLFVWVDQTRINSLDIGVGYE